MKISCNVIQDLLPLYVEDIISEESAKIVEEHVQNCNNCQEILDEMKDTKTESITDDFQKVPLQLVKKNLKKRKIEAIILSALFVFLVMLTMFSYLTRPHYVPYSESGFTILDSGDGNLYASFSDDVTDYHMHKYISENNKIIVEIEAWSSVWDNIMGKETPIVRLSSKESRIDTVYYCDYTVDENMIVVYGTNDNKNGGFIVLPRLLLGYYFSLACVLAMIFGIVWLIFRHQTKISNVCKYLFFIPISYLISNLFLSTNFVSFSAGRDFIMIMIEGLVIYGIISLGLSILRQHKQDKDF